MLFRLKALSWTNLHWRTSIWSSLAKFLNTAYILYMLFILDVYLLNLISLICKLFQIWTVKLSSILVRIRTAFEWLKIKLKQKNLGCSFQSAPDALVFRHSCDEWKTMYTTAVTNWRRCSPQLWRTEDDVSHSCYVNNCDEQKDDVCRRVPTRILRAQLPVLLRSLSDWHCLRYQQRDLLAGMHSRLGGTVLYSGWATAKPTVCKACMGRGLYPSHFYYLFVIKNIYW